MTTLEQARRAAYDLSPTVRQQAALHLGTHADASVTPELVSLLVAEPDFFVRETLTWAVVRHPWLLGPLDPGRFHPNAAGYAAYTEAVTAAIRPSRLR